MQLWVLVAGPIPLPQELAPVPQGKVTASAPCLGGNGRPQCVPCHHSHFRAPLNRELAVEDDDHPFAGVQGRDGLLQQEFLHLPLQRQVDSALVKDRRKLFSLCLPFHLLQGPKDAAPQTPPPSCSSFHLGISPLALLMGLLYPSGTLCTLREGLLNPSRGAALLLSGSSVSFLNLSEGTQLILGILNLCCLSTSW